MFQFSLVSPRAGSLTGEATWPTAFGCSGDVGFLRPWGSGECSNQGRSRSPGPGV